MNFRKDNKESKGKRPDRKDRPKKEFNEVLLEVRRVTKVTRGWRRMTFRATILIGNQKGKIGIGVAKGKDVAIAVRKASHEAYKNVSIVPITDGGTVPYPMVIKNKASMIKILPAASGTWLKAGSSVRMVLELAGYSNILSKIIGTNNKLNNAITTVMALSKFKGTHKTKAPKKEEVEVTEDKGPVVKTPKKESAKKES